MSELKIALMSTDILERTDGTVALLRLPIPLHALDALNNFVTEAYGIGAECTEDPKGWLLIRMPEKKS